MKAKCNSACYSGVETFIPPEDCDNCQFGFGKPQEIIRLLHCPFCGTSQIQLLANYANREHDKAKCRHCHAEAKVSAWQQRNESNPFPA